MNKYYQDSKSDTVGVIVGEGKSTVDRISAVIVHRVLSPRRRTDLRRVYSRVLRGSVTDIEFETCPFYRDNQGVVSGRVDSRSARIQVDPNLTLRSYRDEKPSRTVLERYWRRAVVPSHGYPPNLKEIAPRCRVTLVTWERWCCLRSFSSRTDHCGSLNFQLLVSIEIHFPLKDFFYFHYHILSVSAENVACQFNQPTDVHFTLVNCAPTLISDFIIN